MKKLKTPRHQNPKYWNWYEAKVWGMAAHASGDEGSIEKGPWRLNWSTVRGSVGVKYYLLTRTDRAFKEYPVKTLDVPAD